MHVSRLLLPTVTLLITVMSLSQGSPVQTGLGEEERQEIVALAVRIVKIAMSGNTGYFASNGKRNGGTVDSLYNLPDLLTVGRR